MSLIAIASDHGGFSLKVDIVSFLNELGYEVNDMGPKNKNSVDYPDYAKKVAEESIDEDVLQEDVEEIPQHVIDEAKVDEAIMRRHDQRQWEMYNDPDMNWSGLR